MNLTKNPLIAPLCKALLSKLIIAVHLSILFYIAYIFLVVWAFWYRVVKTIKGHRYLYDQRTWREGGHVRTQSRYIGLAGDPGTGSTTAHAGLSDTAERFLASRLSGSLEKDKIFSGEGSDLGRIVGKGSEIRLSDGSRRGLRLREEDKAIFLSGIAVDVKASGIGTRAINALKEYANKTNKLIFAEDVVNVPFFKANAFVREGQDWVYNPRVAQQPVTERANSRDIYKQVTDRILADLEKGVRPWDRPWQVRAPTRPLRHNGEPYRGINIIMLWLSAAEQGFSSPHWMTYRQAQELGGHVRKGEKGTWIAYASTFTRIAQDKTGEPVYDDEGNELTEEIPFLKGYTVFNADQIEGLPDKYRQPLPEALDPSQRLAQADEFIAATGADIRHGGNRAYYTADGDYIQMPPFETFKEPEGYVATQVHELVHWTKHPTRLDRDLGRQRWGDEGYAMEELVAELGAAFICADLGIAPKTRDEHSSYIGSWLNVLKNDKRGIFAAASFAQKAADYLHGDREG